MTPDNWQLLFLALSAVAGWAARHWHLIGPAPKPAPGPAPAPAPAPPAPSAPPAYPALDEILRLLRLLLAQQQGPAAEAAPPGPSVTHMVPLTVSVAAGKPSAPTA